MRVVTLVAIQVLPFLLRSLNRPSWLSDLRALYQTILRDRVFALSSDLYEPELPENLEADYDLHQVSIPTQKETQGSLLRALGRTHYGGRLW